MTHRERITAQQAEPVPKPRAPVPDPTGLLALQRTAGNQAVVRMLARAPAEPVAYVPAAPPQVRVEDGAKRSWKWEPHLWGQTWPEKLEVTIDARKEGATWKPVVTELVGRYSMEARLLPGVRQVKGPGKNTTKGNFREQLADLEALAPPGAKVRWYMIEAVRAHEAVHAAHLDPVLQRIAPKIVAALEAVVLQDDGKMDAIKAARRLEQEPAFEKAVADGLDLWQEDVVLDSVLDDVPTGPTKAAERAVVEPMIQDIRAEAARQGWPP
jgi:hypothetical protein